jgi:hypothetical protein
MSKQSSFVQDAYNEGCRTRSQTQFDGALNRYLTRYPQVTGELAAHAVAHILVRAGI